MAHRHCGDYRNNYLVPNDEICERHGSRNCIPCRRAKRGLTGRQLEIVKWLCEGKSTVETASILGLKRQTIRNACVVIYEILGIRGVAMLTRWAISNGIVSDPPRTQNGAAQTDANSIPTAYAKGTRRTVSRSAEKSPHKARR